MLKKLKIKDFAIIDDIELDFYEGMTVLTGETGAGKSILIDAISLLLGERADKTMVRNKAEEASVLGIFEVKHPELKNLLSHYDIEYNDDISIHRIISRDNQNIIKINDQRVSLKVVSDISSYIADIHSQFDTTSLIHPENYIQLIDHFRKDKVNEYLNSYRQQQNAYLKTYDDYYQLKNKKVETMKQLDLFEFQLKELSKLSLEADELETLYEKVKVLNNIDKINYNLAQSQAILNDQGLIDNLYIVKNNIEELEDTSKDFKEISERLNNLYYELKDIADEIEDKQDSLDYDPSELETMNQRINDLEKIQKKYDKSISELIEYQASLLDIINTIENFDDIILEKENILEKEYLLLIEQAKQLSMLRQTIAKKITQEIIDTLKELEIEYADFMIEFQDIEFKDKFNKSQFKSDGIDQVDFLISTNKGEPLKALSKTASGGEMSRVMLTFKTIFAKSQKIPTIIFDEIDTGISGYIAKKIGRKISETSRFSQVISITHIPQVVAEGIHHLSIRKKVENNQTKVQVKYLTYDERVEEIAQMMSAEAVTDSARNIAKELLART
ncbi:DNA repair protein RecN [Hujiaoplasma nucleasis]|uniref:DNA repair protein RecN n=1 Tax=Hujiaoplasma nucleasis TaxID=2725268 RepID=A0A7L6N0G7_9MOLU|nr:DNA repair protein RecN [Hujiaoplasma nucleasis]QLY39733.1 DNA repair protein RecN [Hujiaoplasma nucleasis]